jgi:UDP-N-acetylglucosamine--N-acetylmuramyl-(pentapeptide) pyrophosphoryl-undecaprenol N-acetylglucosamine transferase
VAYKIIISGGGTGGHIFPGIAIANEVKRRNSNNDVLFVGALGRMEMTKIPQAGYEIKGLPIAGLMRSLSIKNILFPFKLLKSLWLARAIIKNYKPNIVVGVGGYASAPTLKMANSLGVATLIQEQNSYAGIANKWVAKGAKKICVAYPNMNRYFDENKIILTGNPVRSNIINNTLTKVNALQKFGFSSNKKTILVIGGSLGARSINHAVAGVLSELTNNNIQLIWQTGKGYFDDAKTKTAGNPLFCVNEFIYEMEVAYSAADIIVSRAGAISISELCIVGKPLILVPSPNVTDDHQTKNANTLAQNNAAILIKDNEVNDMLMPTILDLLSNEDLQIKQSHELKKIAIHNAAERIVDEIEKCLL